MPSGSLRRLHPVAPGVLLATSRRDRTNSVVLTGPGGTALVVDPAWTPDELDGLAADLAQLQSTVVAVVSTHSHFDHLLWHPAFDGARRWGSAATAGARRVPMLEELGPGFPPSAFRAAPPLEPLAAAVPWPGTRVLPVVTDAHAPGHTSLWLPRERLLLAGDLLSDVEVPLLAEEDPDGTAYRAGLDRLEPFAAGASLVVPGHGSPGADDLARLRNDRDWLDAVDAGDPPERDPRTATAPNRAVFDEIVRIRRAARKHR